MASLGLAINGIDRIISITNTGLETAVGVNYSFSPSLPSGSNISSNTCGATILPGVTCSITIHPGNTPSAPPGNPTPTPIIFTIQGTNTNALTPVINVVDYGSLYQAGYIFSLNDATPNTGSVGGIVLASSDQSNGIIWSSDGNNAVSFDVILAIDETSTPSSPSPTSPAYPVGTPAPQPCDGRLGGSCNSSNIISYYDFNRSAGGSAPTPLNQYAAGLCASTISGFNDWYLPAICQMGYSVTVPDSNCDGSESIQVNLVGPGYVPLSGNYWSSTERAGTSFESSQLAWVQIFDSSASNQTPSLKNVPFNVRCVRDLML